MKKINVIILISILLFFPKCSSIKNSLKQNGGTNGAIANAILDFSETSPLFKKDSVFVLSIESPFKTFLRKKNTILRDTIIYQDIIAINILGVSKKFLSMEGVSSMAIKEINYKQKVPSHYKIVKGKLFYWYDNNSPITEDIFNILNRYNLITNNIEEAHYYSVDDTKKGVDYYFCKNNILKFKKITNNIASGHYKPPRFKCKK